jgi:hypothetical protein
MPKKKIDNCMLIILKFFEIIGRRAAAKRKKLKALGKSRSTDTEEEDEGEEGVDEGLLRQMGNILYTTSLVIEILESVNISHNFI